jgi:hypothetical protein
MECKEEKKQEKEGAEKKAGAGEKAGARVRVRGAEEGASQKRGYKHWCSCT